MSLIERKHLRVATSAYCFGQNTRQCSLSCTQ